MKTIFTILVFNLTFLFASQAQSKVLYRIGNTTIEFENLKHDFGVIPFESDGTYIFKFKNTGSKNLKIEDVKTTCGCTVPEWSDNEILPGESGEIKIKYNTRISGKFEKGITVHANVKNSPVVLKISGEVMPNTNKFKL